MKEFHQNNFLKKSGNKKYISIIILLVIVFLSTLFIVNYIKKNPKDYEYQHLLYDQTKDIVYTSEESYVKVDDKVPTININHENINAINDEIISHYDDYLATYTDWYTYKYSVSGDILSILIKSSRRYSDATHYDILYKTYNIDLNTMTLITDEDLLKRFEIAEDDLRFFITYKFLNYYNDLIEKKYFTKKECDFSCFMESKGIEDYLLDNQYYVNENHLELYKYFNIYTEYKEEEYFTEDSFRFEIT